MCTVIDLTVSEAKIEIMCLGTKGTPDAVTTRSIETTSQVIKQAHDFVYFGGILATMLALDHCD